MRLTIDRDKQRVLEAEVNGTIYRLEGECLKCGACCVFKKDCQHLISEMWDGAAVRVCVIYQNRPHYCAYFPCDPNDAEAPEGCGFRWVKK